MPTTIIRAPGRNRIVVATVACLLSLAACRGRGGDAPQSSAEATPQAIEARRTDIANRRQSFKRVERDLSDFSTQGGMLNAFLEGDRLRLIEATLYGETGQSRRDFYYDDSGRLFFVLETESRYEKPFGPVARTHEYRYYFHEGRLIRLVDEGREVSGADVQYASRVKMVIQLSEELSKVARQP
jgi:hypothetical protein